MTDTNPETLQRLGLTSMVVVSSVDVTPPVELVGEGKGAAGTLLTLGALVASGFAGSTFHHVRLRDAETRGLRLSLLGGQPAIVKVVAAGDLPVAVATVRHSPEATRRDRLDRNTVYVDTALTGGFSVVQGAGCLVVDPAGGGRLTVTLLAEPVDGAEDAPDGQRSFARLLGEWLADSDDSWMGEAAEDLAADGTVWDHAAAAGLVARLWRPQQSHRLHSAAAALRRGEAIRPLVGPLQWAREWSPLATASIASEAQQRIGDLATELAALTNAPAPEDPRWRARALVARRRRDDLESVMHLQRARPEMIGRDACETAIEQLDGLGRKLANVNGGVVPLNDERFSRVAIGDPEAWWAESLIDESDDSPGGRSYEE